MAAALAVVIAGTAGCTFCIQFDATAGARTIPLTAYPGERTQLLTGWQSGGVQLKWREADNYDIYVKLVSGGAPRLTTSPAEDTFPAWSPDGSQIAFIRTGAGIYLISPLGGQERRLTDAQANSLTWMPDGKSLLASIQETYASPSRIFQVSMGGEMRRVTSPPATGSVMASGDWDPAVSPDGQTVAFSRFLLARCVRALGNGGQARRLTNDLRFIEAWSG